MCVMWKLRFSTFEIQFMNIYVIGIFFWGILFVLSKIDSEDVKISGEDLENIIYNLAQDVSSFFSI